MTATSQITADADERVLAFYRTQVYEAIARYIEAAEEIQKTALAIDFGYLPDEDNIQGFTQLEDAIRRARAAAIRFPGGNSSWRPPRLSSPSTTTTHERVSDMQFSEFEIDRDDAEYLADRAGMEGIVEDYSGRGMYGETCLGMIYTTPDAVALVQLGWALRDVEEEWAEETGVVILWEMMTSARTDSMGLDSIVYFPNITIRQDDTP